MAANKDLHYIHALVAIKLADGHRRGTSYGGREILVTPRNLRAENVSTSGSLATSSLGASQRSSRSSSPHPTPSLLATSPTRRRPSLDAALHTAPPAAAPFFNLDPSASPDSPKLTTPTSSGGNLASSGGHQGKIVSVHEMRGESKGSRPATPTTPSLKPAPTSSKSPPGLAGSQRTSATDLNAASAIYTKSPPGLAGSQRSSATDLNATSAKAISASKGPEMSRVRRDTGDSYDAAAAVAAAAAAAAAAGEGSLALPLGTQSYTSTSAPASSLAYKNPLSLSQAEMLGPDGVPLPPEIPPLQSVRATSPGRSRGMMSPLSISSNSNSTGTTPARAQSSQPGSPKMKLVGEEKACAGAGAVAGQHQDSLAKRDSSGEVRQRQLGDITKNFLLLRCGVRLLEVSPLGTTRSFARHFGVAERPAGQPSPMTPLVGRGISMSNSPGLTVLTAPSSAIPSATLSSSSSSSSTPLHGSQVPSSLLPLELDDYVYAASAAYKEHLATVAAIQQRESAEVASTARPIKGFTLFQYKYYLEQSPLQLTESQVNELMTAVVSPGAELRLIASKLLIKMLVDKFCSGLRPNKSTTRQGGHGSSGGAPTPAAAPDGEVELASAFLLKLSCRILGYSLETSKSSSSSTSSSSSSPSSGSFSPQSAAFDPHVISRCRSNLPAKLSTSAASSTASASITSSSTSTTPRSQRAGAASPLAGPPPGISYQPPQQNGSAQKLLVESPRTSSGGSLGPNKPRSSHTRSHSEGFLHISDQGEVDGGGGISCSSTPRDMSTGEEAPGSSGALQSGGQGSGIKKRGTSPLTLGKKRSLAGVKIGLLSGNKRDVEYPAPHSSSILSPARSGKGSSGALRGITLPEMCSAFGNSNNTAVSGVFVAFTLTHTHYIYCTPSHYLLHSRTLYLLHSLTLYLLHSLTLYLLHSLALYLLYSLALYLLYSLSLYLLRSRTL